MSDSVKPPAVTHCHLESGFVHFDPCSSLHNEALKLDTEDVRVIGVKAEGGGGTDERWFSDVFSRLL